MNSNSNNANNNWGVVKNNSKFCHFWALPMYQTLHSSLSLSVTENFNSVRFSFDRQGMQGSERPRNSPMVTELVQNSVPGFCEPKASTSNYHIMWLVQRVQNWKQPKYPSVGEWWYPNYGILNSCLKILSACMSCCRMISKTTSKGEKESCKRYRDISGPHSRTGALCIHICREERPKGCARTAHHSGKGSESGWGLRVLWLELYFWDFFFRWIWPPKERKLGSPFL